MKSTFENAPEESPTGHFKDERWIVFHMPDEGEENEG